MKTIYKYQLKVTDRQTIDMPACAEILSVQMQKGHPCLWALVDPTMAIKQRTFLILGTGHPAPDTVKKFIDTIDMPGGSLVFHVFEEK